MKSPFLLLVLVAVVGSPVHAQPAAPAAPTSPPCLGGVCIGDDVTRLGRIAWDAVPNPVAAAPLAGTPLSADARSLIQRRFRIDPQAFAQVAPYLLLRRFDQVGLHALQGVVAACEGFSIADRMRASYTGAKGYQTIVSFEPVSVAGQLRFQVARITRRYGRLLADEIGALRSRLDDAYGAYPMYPTPTRAGARFLARGRGGATLTLLKPFGGDARRPAELAKNPACEEAAAPGR